MTFGNNTPIIFFHEGYWYADVPYVSGNLTLMKIEETEFLYYKAIVITNNEK